MTRPLYLLLSLAALSLAVIAVVQVRTAIQAGELRAVRMDRDSVQAENVRLKKDLYECAGQQQFFDDEGKMMRKRFLYFLRLRGHKKDYLLWEQGYGITKEGK